MKKPVFIFLLMMISVSLFSQDIINTKTGEKIPCKVTNVDSVNVYFTIVRNNREINTFIQKPSVRDIEYGVARPLDPVQTGYGTDYGYCITIGILQGGGSLVGGDFEIKLADRFAIQAGAGLVGFGCGLNFHLKPTLRSSFLSLQYWHQGVGEGYTQSLLGPSFVFRGKKWLTGQLGLGFTLENGPGWPEDQEPIPAMFTYTIGAYFPW